MAIVVVLEFYGPSKRFSLTLRRSISDHYHRNYEKFTLLNATTNGLSMGLGSFGNRHVLRGNIRPLHFKLGELCFVVF